MTPSGQGHDTVGAIVCHTGWVTRGVNNCGDIDSPRLFNCGSYQNMRRARTPEENEYSSTNGDSGATVIGFVFGQTRRPLVGLHQGTCQGKIFTFQSAALTQLNLGGWYIE